jgi:hypothetical protein
MRLFPILALAVAHSAVADRIQVYLHPAPNVPTSRPAPTLSASQAKAVLSHHLGEQIAEIQELPEDESMWGHLMGLWNGQNHSRPKVVIVEGGVTEQGELFQTFLNAELIACRCVANHITTPLILPSGGFVDRGPTGSILPTSSTSA